MEDALQGGIEANRPVRQFSRVRIAVELGEMAARHVDADAVALSPKHQYTQALFAAALPVDLDGPRADVSLAGEVPSPINPPSACNFHPRCPHATERCAREAPLLRRVGAREVACHFAD